MYSAVYKCVCKQHSDRLYSDVMEHIGNIVTKWANHLATADQPGPENELTFVREFYSVLARYFHALSSIVPIFTYMVSNLQEVTSVYSGDPKIEMSGFLMVQSKLVLKWSGFRMPFKKWTLTIRKPEKIVWFLNAIQKLPN